jgi:hypothetical protein
VPADRTDPEGRAERVAANEAIFRRANERLRETYRAFGADDGLVPFICECANERCTRVVMLALDEYDGVRTRRGRFLVLPGHELLEVERLVAEHERFQVVEKLGPPAKTVDAR